MHRLFKRITTFAGGLPRSLGVAVVRADRVEQQKRRLAVMTGICRIHTDGLPRPGRSGCEMVVFSKDRALQLHALLGSLRECVTHPPRLRIIYAASSRGHAAAYEEMLRLDRHLDIVPVRQERQSAFRDLLIAAISEVVTSRVGFLVDDIVFKDRVDFDEYADFDPRTTVPSLRLGANIGYSFMQQCPQRQPAWVRTTDTRLWWRWSEGEHDWGHALSVDGNLYGRDEMLVLARGLEYRSPNTFENALQSCSDCYGNRLGVCYAVSKIVNLPLNRVQEDYANSSGDVHPDHLLEMWRKGYEIDFRSLRGVTNRSPHQDLEVSFVRREPLNA